MPLFGVFIYFLIVNEIFFFVRSHGFYGSFFFFCSASFTFSFGLYHEKQAVFLELWGLGTVFVARLINGACLV